MNIKVIVKVAYMSAFRPSFCLNGSFARVFKIFRHRQTDTQTHTHTHGTDHSTPAQARGNNEDDDTYAHIMIMTRSTFANFIYLTTGGKLYEKSMKTPLKLHDTE